MRIIRWFKRLLNRQSEEPVTPVPAERVTGERWVKLVDLPGYREWAADYDRLGRIILDLENYHLFVHPRDIENLPAGFFDQRFQEKLDAVYEHFAHMNPPRYVIGDYKRGGKLYERND